MKFTFVDDNVANRGLAGVINNSAEEDQFIVTLDYQQTINQILAKDFPDSGLAGASGLAIHHEPGLWLYMKNQQTSEKDFTADGLVDAEINVARLASIPHGNSVLAIGTSSIENKMPEIPPISGLPIGRFEDLSTGGYDFKDDPYLKPYKYFIENPFMGGYWAQPMGLLFL